MRDVASFLAQASGAVEAGAVRREEKFWADLKVVSLPLLPTCDLRRIRSPSELHFPYL